MINFLRTWIGGSIVFIGWLICPKHLRDINQEILKLGRQKFDENTAEELFRIRDKLKGTINE